MEQFRSGDCFFFFQIHPPLHPTPRKCIHVIQLQIACLELYIFKILCKFVFRTLRYFAFRGLRVSRYSRKLTLKQEKEHEVWKRNFNHITSRPMSSKGLLKMREFLSNNLKIQVGFTKQKPKHQHFVT